MPSIRPYWCHYGKAQTLLLCGRWHLPTVFRKVLSKAAVRHWKQALCHHSGPHQYAVLRSNGAHLCAREAHRLCSRATGNVLLRTDIQNAFNSISRSAVLSALLDTDEALGRTQAAWLCRPSLALAPDADGLRVPLWTEVGIPQGDPLSSLAFTATLGPLLQRLTSSHAVTPLAFADDVLLISPPAIAVDALHIWRTFLQEVDLALATQKTAICDPTDNAAFRTAFTSVYPGTMVSTASITLCGLPVADADAAEAPWPLARGQDGFLRDFLTTARLQLQRRLTALTAFCDQMGPDSPALHASLHILRTNLVPRFTHVLRFAPLRLTLPWTRELDIDLVDWLEHHIALPLRSRTCAWALMTPPALGGLGLTPLIMEALLLCLSGPLPCLLLENIL